MFVTEPLTIGRIPVSTMPTLTPLPVKPWTNALVTPSSPQYHGAFVKSQTRSGSSLSVVVKLAVELVADSPPCVVAIARM